MRCDFSIDATGTQWKVSLWSLERDQDVHDMWASCVLILQQFESLYSRFQQDSFLRQLAHKNGTVDVPEDFVTMLRIYRELYRATDRLLTPLSGRLLSDLGYDEDYSFGEVRNVRIVPDFFSSVQILDPTTLVIDSDLHFDFGALGKGYAMDLIMQHCLAFSTFERILINAGGDVLHWSRDGQKARIALESPEDDTQALGIVEIGNEALASSAINKRRWGKGREFHHIVNPSTGKSTQTLQSAWVIHESAAIADGLATSLFLSSVAQLAGAYDFDYAMIYEDGSLQKSLFFEDSFFSV
jgi:FAD:protein FMN transferase